MGQHLYPDTDSDSTGSRHSLTPAQITAFGDLLRYLRQRSHLTQGELALAVGYSREQITKLENGQRFPDVTILRSRFLSALGLEKEPVLAERLLTLAEGIHDAGNHDDWATTLPDASRFNSHPTNLPSPLTSFIGREHEISEIKRLMNQVRLLALTGAGGVGKTRLAVQVGWKLLNNFVDGVWLVELAPLTNPARVADTVLVALGLSTVLPHKPEETLVDYVQNKRLLLILDNCEHVLVACAHLAERLLQAAPQLHILATSRESLGILSATSWRVPSLTVPDEATETIEMMQNCESVRLFLDRAAAVDDSFALTADNTPFVAQICCRLDGVPLAIELAAARIHVLSVEQIAARLNNRFKIIAGGNITALPRHQTLRAMVDWSYELLSESDRSLLLCLAVFMGGWTLEAAEAVSNNSDTLDLLVALVNKSLVVVEDRQGERRYRLPETIREYAHEKLAESGQRSLVQQRHLDYYTRWIEDNEDHLRDAHQKLWYQRFEIELDNFRTALDYAIHLSKGESGLRLIAGLWFFWFWRGYWREGTAYAKTIFAMTETLRSHIKARALIGASNLAGRLGEYQLFGLWLDEGQALAEALGDEEYVAWARIGHSIQLSDFVQIQPLLQEGIALAEHGGHTWLAADIRFMLGDRARSAGQKALAEQLYSQSVALFRQVGDQSVIANPIGNLGRLALEEGDYQRARMAFEESVSLSRNIGNRPGLGDWLLQLATVGLLQGDYVLAHAAINEGLPISWQIANQEAFADYLVVAAGLADASGGLEQAVMLLGAADRILDQFNLLHQIVDPFSYKQFTAQLTAIRSQLLPSSFEKTWDAGHTLSAETLIQIVKNLHVPT